MKLDNFYFSQNALSTFITCNLKFRRRYIDGLYWPKLWDGQEDLREAIELGNQFHLLAQRYYEGLEDDIPPDHPQAEKLSRWMTELKSFIPLIPGNTYLPEHELRMTKKDIRLVAKFDLVVFTPDKKAVIYDWKTYRKTRKRSFLESQVQTRVYPYVLAEAGGIYVPGIKPEDVAMIYWHPEHMKDGIRFSYSSSRHFQNEKFLFDMIRDIQSRAYDDFLATPDENYCRTCEYRPLCHGESAELIEDDDDMAVEYFSLEDVPEVAF